jgi:thiamine-phosphate pyrophosphorylase
MRGLYAIVDVDALTKRGLEVLPFAEAVLAARPAAVQLRDKSSGARRTLELLRAIAPLAKAARVPFYANDRPDLALLAGCDGVHVGQDDLPVDVTRSLAPGRLRVGLSTHDEAQAEAAIADAPDYVAVGPIFPTSSKERPSPVVGLGRLRAIAARVVAARPGTPVVAIGGVSLESAAAVGAACAAAAVIGALLPEAADGAWAAEVTRRAEELHAAIVGGSAAWPR